MNVVLWKSSKDIIPVDYVEHTLHIYNSLVVDVANTLADGENW